MSCLDLVGRKTLRQFGLRVITTTWMETTSTDGRQVAFL
jgi:hypothetical protein